MIAGTPWLFLDSGVSWKAWKSLEKPGKIKRKFPRFPGRRAQKENFLAFQAFPYVQKSPELLTGMISDTSCLFLDFGVSWKAWKSLEKPGKAKRKFTTWHSWLLLDCGVTQKAWKSQEKIFHIALFGSSSIAGFPEKPGKAKRRPSGSS